MNSLNYEKLEEILRQLKNQPLENGTLLGLPEEDREIAVLAAELQSIPLLNAPHAKIRRKYALASEPIPLWKNLVFSFRYSIGIAILLCVMFTSGIAYSTAGSLPGEKLFGLKKSAEQFRVKFALNGAQRAYLQLQIAKKRLNEAQQIVQNQNSEAAFLAISEVSKATEIAANEVQTLSPKSIKESSRPLLSSLEDVGKQEKDLVFQLSQNGSAQEGKEDVIALSLKNQTRVSEIKRSVAISTAEEAIASLSSPDNAVTISGQITQIGKTSITVEKTTFFITEKTIISSSDEKIINPEDLKINAKVAVSGEKNQTQILALKVAVLEKSEELAGEVKGETTQTHAPNSTTPSSILSPSNEESDSEKANQATGSFIIEDPSPQFFP
ncbi:MAG: DUF5667 domain-containing protein [Patescibacteria group bacterium]